MLRIEGRHDQNNVQVDHYHEHKNLKRWAVLMSSRFPRSRQMSVVNLKKNNILIENYL